MSHEKNDLFSQLLLLISDNDMLNYEHNVMQQTANILSNMKIFLKMKG